MLDAIITNLIGNLADVIAITAMTAADDHQTRRDKLADYQAKGRQAAVPLLTAVVADLQTAVRNRYVDWLAHPRLGHEPPAAELRAAEIGLNEAVMELKANPSCLHQALAIAASIRLTAITEALGVACIYQDASKRSTPVAAKRVAKSIRADDKRLNRRAPVIEDVPDALRPVVARLGSLHPAHAGAIEDLEAQRGGSLDSGGLVTRLAALVAHADHQAFVETLATQAATFDSPAEAEPAATDIAVATDMASILPSTLASKPSTARGPVAPSISREAAAIVDAPRADLDVDADVAAVTKFVADNPWALIEREGRYTLKQLKRRNITLAFERVAALPAMQDALGSIHASQRLLLR